MTDLVWRASKDRRLIGIIVFACAGVLWLLFVAFESYIAGYQSCMVSGPFDPRAFPMEAGPESSGFIMWPLGRECVWRTAGGGTVVAQSGWGSTIVMVCLGAISLWGAVIAAIPLRPRYGKTS